MTDINISAAMMRQLFRPCDPWFIASVCRARCCDSPTSPSGTLITIHPTEEARIMASGGVIERGLLVTPNKRCTFKTAEHLCGIHEAGQPFGCAASPFTLNKSRTLIVRNRYRMLKCYRAEGAIPAYLAHGRSLAAILGPEVAAQLTTHLDSSGGDIRALIDPDILGMLETNDAIKRAVKETL